MQLRSLTSRSGWTIGLISLPLLAFLLLPLVALVYRASSGDFWNRLFSEGVLQAIQLSFVTTLLATAVSILIGTPAAFLMARFRFPLKRLLDIVIDLPSVLPPAVVGVALLMAFGRRGIVGSFLEDWGLHIAFSPIAVVLAQTFIAVPFYVRAATIGFTGIEPELEQAAALDGADGWRTFRYIVLPLSWSALISGAVMSWARALGEFGATIIFAGNFPGRTQTMPLAIYIGFEIDLDIALTLSLILIVLSSTALLIVRWLLQRE